MYMRETLACTESIHEHVVQWVHGARECREVMGHQHVVEGHGTIGHEDVVEAMKHEHVVEVMGHEHVVKAMGHEHVVEAMGHEHVVEAMIHEHVVEHIVTLACSRGHGT